MCFLGALVEGVLPETPRAKPQTLKASIKPPRDSNISLKEYLGSFKGSYKGSIGFRVQGTAISLN